MLGSVGASMVWCPGGPGGPEASLQQGPVLLQLLVLLSAIKKASGQLRGLPLCGCLPRPRPTPTGSVGSEATFSHVALEQGQVKARSDTEESVSAMNALGKGSQEFRILWEQPSGAQDYTAIPASWPLLTDLTEPEGQSWGCLSRAGEGDSFLCSESNSL